MGRFPKKCEIHFYYSVTEIKDRIEKAFAYGEFTYQELREILPGIDARQIIALTMRGIVRESPKRYALIEETSRYNS